MNIRISRQSEVPIREQLASQIEFLIATRELGPGDALPSVRALARRLAIHYNTVSEAYRDLVDKNLLTRKRGTNLVVRSSQEPPRLPPAKDLDDLINEAVRAAREHGYTLQQLRQRVRERMLAEPADHVLVLSDERGMRVLLRTELQEALRCPVESCSPEELGANPGLAVGAVVLSPPGPMPEVASVLPKDRTPIRLAYSPADEHVDLIRGLQQPSLIALVSISAYCLRIARGVLAAVIGRQHSVREYLLAGKSPGIPRGADIFFCDSITYGVVRARKTKAKVVPYRLISRECLAEVSAVMSEAR